MAKIIVPEGQAVNYNQMRFAYTDSATDTDYYEVEDGSGDGSVKSPFGSQLANIWNFGKSAAAQTQATTGVQPAARKSLPSFNLLHVAGLVLLIVGGVWAYQKWFSKKAA